MVSMTIGEWLVSATKKLQSAGVPTARLDCLVLLEDAIGCDRSWLLAHPKIELESSKVSKLENSLLRRQKHEPLAYIRGKSEFFGREFAVNAHTLEPRPETETMIELLTQVMSKEHGARSNEFSLVDVGTGSGCIAVTVKLELPQMMVYATDIDEKCLETAQQNAQNLNADVTFFHGNLLQPLPSSIFHRPTSILANLPYVSDAHQINQAAQHEPKHAIFGGVDGLDYYREMFAQLHYLTSHLPSSTFHLPMYVFTESLPPQHQLLTEIAAKHGYKLVQIEDFIQLFELSSS